MGEWKLNVIPSSARPILFNEELCIGCNQCVQVCQVDILVPNPENGKVPIVAYPGECYYCGCCGMVCPTGALELRHPLMNQAKFIPKKEYK